MAFIRRDRLHFPILNPTPQASNNMQNLLNLDFDTTITDAYKTFKTGTFAVMAKLNDKLTKYEVDTVFPEGSDFEDVFAALPQDHARIIVVNLKYTTESYGHREKIVMVHWSPSDAKVKEKMVYTASKGVFSAHLDGIAFTVQASNFSEMSADFLTERCLSRYS